MAENDKVLNTSVWLKFERADRDQVPSLTCKCAVCARFNNKLVSMRNYCPTIVEGTTNIKMSLFKEHAATNNNARAMVLFKKQQSSSFCEYTPIVKALLQPSMDDHTRATIKRKFDVAYMIAKEKLAFSWKSCMAFTSGKATKTIVLAQLSSSSLHVNSEKS